MKKKIGTVINSLLMSLVILSYFVGIFLMTKIEKINDVKNPVIAILLLFGLPLILPTTIEIIRRKIFGIPTVYPERIELGIEATKFYNKLLKELPKEYKQTRDKDYIKSFEKKTTYELDKYNGNKNLVLIDYEKLKNNNMNPTQYIRDLAEYYKKRRTGEKYFSEVYLILFVEETTEEIFDMLKENAMYFPRETRYSQHSYEKTPCIIPFAIDKSSVSFGEFTWGNRFYLRKKEDVKWWINKYKN